MITGSVYPQGDLEAVIGGRGRGRKKSRGSGQRL